MNDSLIYLTYFGIFAFIAIIITHFVVYRYTKIKVRCENCGSERLRFFELSTIATPDVEVDYSVYICADCENKIYKKIK